MTPDRWTTIDRIFHEALERSPADRPAFLDEACAGDAALRQEVESLLGHESAAGSFLERPALQHEALHLAREAARASAAPEIPGFTIQRTLGEGGMGIVYLAEQLQPIRRQVALKLIKYGMDTRQVLARFEAERQALALMHHPHIAAVYDAGTTVDGRPYFVMEYVEGESITDYCDRRRLSTRERLELFVLVCGGVQHAHQKGVIHRDLKPSNVLVTDADGRPCPKIIDFGVARAIDRTVAARTTFTEHGTIVGTPEYMSPEQAAFSQDIDTTTDVYSLGVLLYELLVGALPFDPELLRAAGYDEMRRIIRESDPAKPSSRLTEAGDRAAAAALARHTDAGRLTRQLRGDLDWIALKALDKDRRRRYPTVAALAADVGHFLSNEPIAARAPSAVYRLRKFAVRYRGVVAAASVVLVVLVAGLVASLTQYARAEIQRAEADRQRAQADRQREQADEQRAAAFVARNDALAATDEANRQRSAAARDAEAAMAARRLAELHGYDSTIGAADGELRLNFGLAARTRLLAVPPSLRGWEWRHLFLETDSSLKTLTASSPCRTPLGQDAGYAAQHNALAQDSDRSHLYLARCDTVTVWDLPNGAPHEYHLPGTPLAFDGQGNAVVGVLTGASVDAHWTVRLIEAATGRVTREWGPLAAEPSCASLDRSGMRVAVGLRAAVAPGRPATGAKDVFEIWDAVTGSRVSTLAPAPPRVDLRATQYPSCWVAFSPAANLIATSGAQVHVWRAVNGEHVAEDSGQSYAISQPIAWQPDGRAIAIGRSTGLVELLDVVDTGRVVVFQAQGGIGLLSAQSGNRPLTPVADHANQVLALSFSKDGSRILSGTGINVCVWDVEGRRLSTMLFGHDAPVHGMVADGEGRFVTADVSGAVKIWPAVGYGAMTVVPDTVGIVRFVLSADGGLLSTSSADGGLAQWTMQGLQKRVVREGSGRLDPKSPAFNRQAADPVRITSLATSADGRELFSGIADSVGTTHAWSTTGRPASTFALNDKPGTGCENMNQSQPGVPSSIYPVNEMLVSPDGRSLAYRQGKCLIVRDLASSATVATLHAFVNAGNLGDMRDFAFRPDGILLVSSFRPEASVLLWDWRHDRVLARQVFPNPTPRWLALSADGKTVALRTGASGQVSIWDGDLRRERGRLEVGDVADFALSPDGRRLATTSVTSASVRIWDTETGEPLLVLLDTDHHRAGLAFTPDGRLIAGRVGGGFTIWDSVKRQ